jgi:hypothetical protein
MLLTYRDCSKLKGKEWCMLEVRSEKTIEPTLRRIGKQIPQIFREDAVELFIPVGHRDLDVFDLTAAAYLFVRSDSFQGLLRLKTITGVVSLVTEGDSNRPNKVIRVSDTEVQKLMSPAEKQFREHSSGVEVGSFVRVLNGETRDFCGTVTAIGAGRAVIRITLKTKSIMLETPVWNLLNLSYVPKDIRTYYYCPLVSTLKEDDEKEGEKALPELYAEFDAEEAEALKEATTEKEIGEIKDSTVRRKFAAASRAKDIKEALSLIREDTKLGESPLVPTAKRKDQHEPLKKSRQKTVTALVRKLILVDGIHVPSTIAAKIVEAIKKGEVKSPKNYFIIYTIVKDNVMKHWVKKENPAFKNYREVVKKYGDTYKFSAKQIAKVDPSLPIPLGSSKED